MDWLRSCYTAPCRFDAEGDATATIRWYKAAPDAKGFPGKHAFASSVWQDDHGLKFSGPGELRDDHKWSRNGKKPCPGQEWQGQLEWYATGLTPEILAGPHPVPCCPEILPPGGVRIHGHGTWPGVINPPLIPTMPVVCSCSTVLPI